MDVPGPVLVVLALSMRRMRSLLPLSAVPSPNEKISSLPLLGIVVHTSK